MEQKLKTRTFLEARIREWIAGEEEVLSYYTGGRAEFPIANQLRGRISAYKNVLVLIEKQEGKNETGN